MPLSGDRREDQDTQLPIDELNSLPAGHQIQVSRVANLDAKAKRIIEILQSDGRASYADIGREINLSEASVRARIMRLCKDQVIKIVGVVDPPKVGFHRQAMLALQVTGPVSVIAAQLSQLERVIYVVQTCGRFDLLLEVVCRDDNDLIRFKDSLVARCSQIRHCETFVYLDIHKQEYNWGRIL